MTPHRRRTSRILLLDDRDRLLLLCGRDPRRDGARWWFTVGGGIEDGEDALAAAVRELREETTLTVVADRLGPLAWTHRTRFSVDGRHFDQSEEYRLCRLTAAEAAAARIDTEEARYGHHWWSIDELATTEQTVRPRRLAHHLTELLRDGIGQVPLHLGDFDEDADSDSGAG
ncbi:NUDIX hydrolase [Kitasatospora sp. NPDC048407]|uniref:NUDIX hydrolase n=1 Tax=Kitasatospora sp. NPDC048407 TaxID=3364051 RepID=UPI003718204A